MTKPLIVYVSGAPGSGKTTLAKLLSEELYIPHISSDLVHGGVALLNPGHNRKQTLLDVFVPNMVAMAQKGVSFVADHVLQKGLSETDIIDKLRPHATIMYIHAQCTSPIERYIARVEASNVTSIVTQREYLLQRAATHKNNLDRTSTALELGVPTLIVNTDDGYDPDLNAIITFIQTNYTH